MDREKDIFYKAFIERDTAFEGVFVVAMKATGIFCRPTCLIKQKFENIEFYLSPSEALLNGYRPCKICKPMDTVDNPPQHSKDKHFIHITHIETELGLMIAGATDRGVCMLDFADYKLLDLELRQLEATFKAPLLLGHNPHLDRLENQLQEYFRGERRDFDIPLDLAGTEFQKQVWLSLLKIPYGETVSYAKQAELIGKPTAIRAVANANGKNKVAILLPCHRIIGADGSMTGYGGGIWRKKKLLALEQANLTK